MIELIHHKIIWVVTWGLFDMDCPVDVLQMVINLQVSISPEIYPALVTEVGFAKRALDVITPVVLFKHRPAVWTFCGDDVGSHEFLS